MSRIRIGILTGTLLLLCMTVCFAKPFESKQGGASLYIGEAACYGEHAVQDEFLTHFKIKLQENLQGAQNDGKFHLVGSSFFAGGESAADQEILSRILMDAIAYGPLFEKAYANAQMIHYAEGIFGEEYFWDEGKLAQRKAGAGKPYRISQAMTDAAKNIGAKYGAEYLIFCNLIDVNVELAHSIFNASSTLEERPKHIRMETSVYLVNAKTGMVYEGHILTEKMGRIQNLFGQYGKAMTAEALLEAMFDVQSKKIVKDVCGNGKKALESHA